MKTVGFVMFLCALYVTILHQRKDTLLLSNNVILRKHNEHAIVVFDEMWWSLFCKYAKRDQLCHPYCYMTCGLPFDFLLPREFCARNHPFFLYVKHKIRPTAKKGLSKLVYDFRRKSNVFLLNILASL